ncbi:MAG TPA: DUF488 domain-containing protein [Syntrophales bacterium]|nr:DUF488 domain-containing protein [Syntrophales bacterium]
MEECLISGVRRLYADSFICREGIEQLIELARGKRAAIMCSEAVPWRCHTSFIGDALLARNFHVEDIMSDKASKPHTLRLRASVKGLLITYPKTGT